MYKGDNKTTIVYWGAGEIGKTCIRCHPEVKPEFIIDSYSEDNQYQGISIKRPFEVEEWSEIFVVITVEKRDEIEKYLAKRGLTFGKDYIGYENLFDYNVTDCEGTIHYARKRTESNPDLKNRIIIQVPFYFSDRMEPVCVFFEKYIKAHGNDNFLILHGIQYFGDETMKERFGCEMIPYRIPEAKDMNKDNWKALLSHLSPEEKTFIDDVETRKKSDISLELLEKRYIYYRELLKILKPRGIIWWGGWARDTYLVKQIAMNNGYGFATAEHGWLKGTINIDHEGIAGQSELLKISVLKDSKIIKDKYDNIQDIFEQITVIPSEGELRQSNLAWIKTDRPRFLLVGMGDYGMDMNPNSYYWNDYISDCVKGSIDAMYICSEICRRNGWQLIYKPHPKESNNQIIERIDVEACIFVDNISIDELIDYSDVVISITSAVDFNVCLHDKPLVQLGKNSLNDAGCTYVVHGKSEIEAKMADALKNGLTIEQKKAYEEHIQHCFMG